MGEEHSKIINRVIKNNLNFYFIVAVENKNRNACFSNNWRKCTTLYVPGIDFHKHNSNNNDIDTFSGTRMGCPIVTNFLNRFVDQYPICKYKIDKKNNIESFFKK